MRVDTGGKYTEKCQKCEEIHLGCESNVLKISANVKCEENIQRRGENIQRRGENILKLDVLALIALIAFSPICIQGLIDGRVEPELFTTKLQKELNSSPQVKARLEI